MTYCRGSLYRNNSCGCSNNNTGAGCVCDNNGNCSCSNGIGGCSTGSCGCSGNSGVGGCNTGSCGCGTRPHYPFPPRPSVCSTCPPGTYPCPCRPPFFPWYPGCGCNGCNGCNGCGSNGMPPEREDSFALLNSSGSTLATGSIVPLRYVLGTGDFAKNTTGGTVSLDSGTYTAVYSLSGVVPTAATTVTVTPEYGGMLHPEYSRSFTSGIAGESFELSGIFGANLPSDTTLSLNVTITGDAAADTTITGVNASMIVNKTSDYSNGN